MRWIYISPHLDDACFSAGGLIYEQTQAGNLVEIWTIMCGLPVEEVELTDLAKILHRQWGTSSAEETIRIRRAENEKAAGILGARAVYFDFLDCIYRRGPNGQALYTNVFIQPHKAESDLPMQIAKVILECLQPDDVLVCPLALGGHVDHVIVRKAMELLGRSLLYDADIPYLLNKPHKLKLKTIWMKELVHAISEAGLDSWLKANCAYQSQIETEFKNLELMHEKISAHWAERKGIRLWKTNRKGIRS